jgi:hypothetical protein
MWLNHKPLGGIREKPEKIPPNLSQSPVFFHNQELNGDFKVTETETFSMP